MNKQQTKQAEAKKLLIEGSLGVKPGDMILFVVKPSRSSLNKRIKVYQVKLDHDGKQILLSLTRNVAVLMGLANSDTAEHKAFSDGMLSDYSQGELIHYLTVKLFGETIAKLNPLVGQSIYM